MNLVGKIFIVLIFVMSLLWMAFSTAVYATHRNWKEHVENPDDGLKVRLDRQKERNDEIKAQLDSMSESLAAEKAAKRQALTKLETERIQLQTQLDEQAEKIASLDQSEADAVAALKAAHEQEAKLRSEVEGLRDGIEQAQKDRDDYFDRLVKKTDELHQLINEYRTLRSRVDVLVADLAKANEVLRKHGLEPEPARYTGVAPKVEGVVLSAGEDGMVEISIGSDDGLMKGHQLEVVRQTGGAPTYLSRIEVMETAPDKAVCKVLPEFQQRTIQRNDRVISQLK